MFSNPFDGGVAAGGVGWYSSTNVGVKLFWASWFCAAAFSASVGFTVSASGAVAATMAVKGMILVGRYRWGRAPGYVLVTHGPHQPADALELLGQLVDVRDRGRFNIYSPAREGRSVGGGLGAEYRLTRALELQAAATLEHGDAEEGWTASSLTARLRWVR